MRKCLAIFPVLVLLAAIAARPVQPAPAQTHGGLLDLTIKSCADFSVTESHLGAAFHTITKGYANVPTQREPVPQLEGVETPEKVREFIDWYANGGALEMVLASEQCRAETLTKYGENEAARAGFYMAEERAINAEFFADKLLKRFTGTGLWKR